MTDDEMVAMVRSLVGEPRLEAYSEAYLAIAKSAVIERLFPYRGDAAWEDVPSKHHARTCEIAVYLVNRRGAEGETSHSENGVSRTYGSAAVPEGFFDGMAPYVGVPL